MLTLLEQSEKSKCLTSQQCEKENLSRFWNKIGITVIVNDTGSYMLETPLYPKVLARVKIFRCGQSAGKTCRLCWGMNPHTRERSTLWYLMVLTDHRIVIWPEVKILWACCMWGHYSFSPRPPQSFIGYEIGWRRGDSKIPFRRLLNKVCKNPQRLNAKPPIKVGVKI